MDDINDRLNKLSRQLDTLDDTSVKYQVSSKQSRTPQKGRWTNFVRSSWKSDGPKLQIRNAIGTPNSVWRWARNTNLFQAHAFLQKNLSYNKLHSDLQFTADVCATVISSHSLRIAASVLFVHFHHCYTVFLSNKQCSESCSVDQSAKITAEFSSCSQCVEV